MGRFGRSKTGRHSYFITVGQSVGSPIWRQPLDPPLLHRIFFERPLKTPTRAPSASEWDLLEHLGCFGAQGQLRILLFHMWVRSPRAIAAEQSRPLPESSLTPPTSPGPDSSARQSVSYRSPGRLPL